MHHSSCEFYTTSQGAWEAMLGSLESARESIDLEQYIFESGGIGDRFLEVLKRKSRQGVSVRMLLDMAGSFYFFQSALPRELEDCGIQIRFFNAISPWRIHNFFSWFFRDHRKTLIVDKKVGFVSGVGVAEHMRDWRDTTGSLRGKVVGDISRSFENMWNISGRRRAFYRPKEKRLYRQGDDFVINAPYFQKRFLYHAIVSALKDARKNILITNSYFVPNNRLVGILRHKAKQGLDVSIILPDKIDVPIVAVASNSSFQELLKSGVKIFKYQGEILHAKTLVVDDAWATYGSFNMDNLSFTYNHEANIVTTDPACVNELKRHFLIDLGHSRQVFFSEWKKRPLFQKFKELLVSPIRGIL